MNTSLKQSWIIAGFLIVFFLELAAILTLNQGIFIFSLDDPYIHISLAENIIQGHYGINPNESTAPSSSILWPFLIAPLTASTLAPHLILIVNLVLALGCVFIFFKFINVYIASEKVKHSTMLHCIAILFILIANLIGLVFVGMEHNLQVFLGCLIMLGMLDEEKYKRIPWWFVLAITLIPLIRYESIAISAPVLLYYFLKGYRRPMVLSGLVITVSVILFSFFLKHNGLSILPNSVLAKSSDTASNSRIISMLKNFIMNSLNPFGWSLVILTILNARIFLKDKAWIAGIVCCAALLHLLAGKIWWYGRYETYLLIILSMSFVYHRKENIQSWFINKTLLKPALVIAIFLFSPIFILLTTPLISNAIYSQPYQFHRFITEIYKQPIGTHDIGWVSYRNNEYVLDLWGLASKEALEHRMKSHDSPQWMDELSKKNNVKLVWLTQHWFQQVPDHWIHVAAFNRNDALSKIPTAGVVDFYVTDPSALDKIVEKLKQFKQQLPPPMTLTILEK